MGYSFARVSAAVGLRVEDYFQQGRRAWLRLHEKGGKRHEVPYHHALAGFEKGLAGRIAAIPILGGLYHRYVGVRFLDRHSGNAGSLGRDDSSFDLVGMSMSKQN